MAPVSQETAVSASTKTGFGSRGGGKDSTRVDWFERLADPFGDRLLPAPSLRHD